MSVRFSIVRPPCGLPTTIARVYDHFCANNDKIVRCPDDHRTVFVRGSYDVSAMCLRATGLRFFQICHCGEINKIVEATMRVNLKDNCKVSLQRPHGNGDLDLVLASYTRRKANVTKAYETLYFYNFL